MFLYYKMGKFTLPVPLRKWPIPVLVFFAAIMVFGGIALLLRPPMTDEDGFGVVLTKLNSLKAHGLPLLSKPGSDSDTIRRVKRFESFSTSGKIENGYLQVKMNSDGSIGWLLKDIAQPRAKETLGSFQRAVSYTSRDFCSVLFRWRSAAEIAGGLLLVASMFALFGRTRADSYSRKIDFVAILLAAAGSLGTKIVIRKLVPFSPEVYLLELTFARGCLLIQYALPTMLASFMANLFFGKCRKALAVLEFVAVFICIFLLYIGWGYGAAWWD